MNTGKHFTIIRDLNLRSPVCDVVFLDKGYSQDTKHIVTTEDGGCYLLRMSEVTLTEVRQEEFECIRRLHDQGIRCPKTIKFGVDEEVCFMLVTYLEGECAEDALPLLPLTHQRHIGRQAGEELLKIHQAFESPSRVDDYARRTEKYNLHWKMAADLGFTGQIRERAAKYVDQHVHLLRNRPTTFRHGDYHPGNLIVHDGAFQGVIDFNRCDWGDPIDDFYKTAWFGAPLSPEFACGMIEAYFQGAPPQDFWPLYTLYVAMVLPSDLVWTHMYYPDQMDRSYRLIEEIAQTHDFENGGPPTWWG